MNTKEKIKKILAGKTDLDQVQFNSLLDSIPDNPNILWYPSSGNDYRDILELNEITENSDSPDLFIHTDYKTDWLTLNGVVPQDNMDYCESVTIQNKYELILTQKINYEINPSFVDFPFDGPYQPTIYLLDILMITQEQIAINKKVVFFLFENINFLNEILLKNDISISYIVKVREGCGFGGNKKSISLVYAFLSVLKTKVLIVDNEEFTDFNLINRIKNQHNLVLYGYNLRENRRINNWSKKNVKVFSISFNKCDLDNNYLNRILNQIRQD